MSKPSSWPLTTDATRYIIPSSDVSWLKNQPLTSALYPLCVGYYPQAHDHHIHRSAHDDWLMLYCIKGKAHIKVAARTLTIEPGCLVYLPKGIIHEYWSDTEDPWSVYWTHFDGREISSFTERIENEHFPYVMQIGINERLLIYFQELLLIAEDDSSPRTLIYSSNVLKSTLSLLTLILERKQKRSVESPINYQEVIGYFSENLNSSLDLEQLSAKFKVSKFSLSRSFKSSTGNSPMDYYMKMKMKRAQSLLHSTGLSIKEIGSELGFRDPYHFSRAFKKTTGISPKYFRELNKG